MKKSTINIINSVLIAILGYFVLSVCSVNVSAKNYHNLLQQVDLGIDSTQLFEITGSPTKRVDVVRFFYNYDQAVISNGEVVDIRIFHTERQSSNPDETANLKSIGYRPISVLRIGMSVDEVLSIAGEPTKKENGTDLYFTNRHRVEVSNGKVSKVDAHIKIGMDILDWIRLNFSKGGLLFMNITLAFIMFGVALGIKTSHFKNVVVKPKSAIIGIISQFVALPALTYLLVLIINPTPSVALGMILVAACPGGNISNFMSSLAKANVELSISLTAFATLSAIFLTPLNFALWGSLYSGTANLLVPIEIDAWEMMKTVFILLGIPIVVGVWFANQFPTITQKITKPIKIISFVAFIGFIVAAFASNFKFFLSYIHFIILIVLVHNFLALATGFSIASLFGLPKADRRTITIETGIQNSGLGLVLIFNPNLFNGLGGMAFIAAWWGIWHIISGLVVSSFWSRKKMQE
jgi:BASS family bile acid:Na+ symporter